MQPVDIPSRIPVASGDLSTAMIRPLGYLVLGCRLTFDERLDAAVLSRAVRLLLDAEPVLGCWFKEGFSGAEWERCANLDDSLYFSVVDTRDIEEDAAAFHGEAFDEHGPRLAVRLLRTEAHDEVCLRLDHIVADGWATKELAYTLADTYSRLLLDRAYSIPPNLTPRPSGGDLWNAMSDDQREAANRGSVRPAANKWKMPLPAGTGSDLSVRRLTLGPEQFAAVKDYGDARGATVTEMLLTALMRSLARVYPPDTGVPFTPSITSNARQYTDEASIMRMCVLAGSSTPVIVHQRDDDFAAALGRVTEGVRPCRESLWGAKFLAKPVRFYRLIQAIMTLLLRSMYRSGTAAPIVMNIGVMDEARLAFGDALPIAAHMTGSIPKGPGFGATISTYRDTLTVWMGNYEHHVDPALVERVLQGMGEELSSVRA
ncbi:MAG: hypothetical protein U1E26_09790 [Coriobacteriia bacterium]|nr:hypothetical protein [Coriobacteriia bacterium]